MRLPSITALISSIVTRIKVNGRREITGTVLQDVCIDIVDTLKQQGFSIYDGTLTYNEGNTAIYQNKLVIANKTTTGAYNPSDWAFLMSPVIFEFPAYNPTEVLSGGETRRYQFKLYTAIVNATGQLPTNTEFWTSQIAQEGTFGEQYRQYGWYLTDSVVLRNDILYRLTEPSPFKSVGFETELLAGSWKIITPVSYLKYVTKSQTLTADATSTINYDTNALAVIVTILDADGKPAGEISWNPNEDDHLNAIDIFTVKEVLNAQIIIVTV